MATPSIIQRGFLLKAKEYYEKHLQLLNIIIPANLTNKEVEVLAMFMSLDKNIIEDEMINPVSRKKVMDNLKLSPGGLGNHLKSMTEKKALIRNEVTGSIRLNPHLRPNETVQGYQIKIKRDEN